MEISLFTDVNRFLKISFLIEIGFHSLKLGEFSKIIDNLLKMVIKIFVLQKLKSHAVITQFYISFNLC